jgi:hypothetical protein
MASLLSGRELLPLRSFETPQGPAALVTSVLKTMLSPARYKSFFTEN